MTVVPHGDGTGMFDVYSGENGEPYVVDLAGEHDRCTCPDVQHNLEDGERCKHSRRVRLEFGMTPFEDLPRVREEHAALTDVELARRRHGTNVEPEPEPEPITVSDAKPARAIATDGGVVVSEPETLDSGGEDAGADLPADATVHLHGVVAETTSTTADLPDLFRRRHRREVRSGALDCDVTSAHADDFSSLDRGARVILDHFNSEGVGFGF
jgi:hypothetical protein